MENIVGLERYVESVSFSNTLIKRADSVVIKESLDKIPTKLRESISDASDAEGWWVPISHYGNYKNGNNRIYNTELWKNVIDKQQSYWKGSPMLTDHPQGDSDGNPKDICGVWLDCKMGEPSKNGVGIVYGLLIPSGRNGEDLKDHLRKGLRVGTSSSGFGRLMPDGITVDPDTYQIERLADFVLCPSQGTYFSWDESNEGIADNIRESEDYIYESRSSKNIDNEEIIKEKFVKDSRFTKLEEKKFRRDMESFLESADNIKDPQERLNEFREIRSYFEEGICSDLREKVEAKITEQETFIKEMLSQSIEMKEQLGIESTRDLKNKLTKICENTKLAEKEAHDWKKISEQLQLKLNEIREELNLRPTNEFVEYQNEKIESLTESLNTHDAQASDLVKNLIKEYKSLKEAFDEASAKVCSLETKVKSLSEKADELEANLEASSNEVAILEEQLTVSNDLLRETNKKCSSFKTILLSERKKYEDAYKEIDNLKALNEKASKNLTAISKEARDAQLKIREAKWNENAKKANNLTDTESFYESLYKLYGNQMEEHKAKIAGAKSLAEAKQYFYLKVMQNLSEAKAIDSMRIPETLSVDGDERAKIFKGARFIKESTLDRMPKGWK